MLFFVLVLLFAAPDGSRHEGVGVFATAKDCEAAKSKNIAALAAAGSQEFGASCVAVNVDKVS